MEFISNQAKQANNKSLITFHRSFLQISSLLYQTGEEMHHVLQDYQIVAHNLTDKRL